MLALDISNYAGYLSPETIEAWKAAGVKRVIVRASTEGGIYIAIARQQLAACQAAGFALHAYCWLYWSRPLTAQVWAAVEVLDGYPVKTLWLDCEGDADLLPEEMVEAVRGLVNACKLPCGIYTRREWWKRYTVNTEEFCHLPLWDCDLGAAQLGDFVPYGGWDDRAMRQVQFDAEIGGTKVDLNVYES